MGTQGLAAWCARLRGEVEEVLAGLPAAPSAAWDVVRGLLGDPPDLVRRALPGTRQLLFLETAVNVGRLEEAIVRPLLRAEAGGPAAAQRAPLRTYGDVVRALLDAKAVLLEPGGIAAMPMAGWPKRDPNEPPSELVPQGPHVGFVESLQSNVALLRQRVRERHLRWRRVVVGQHSHVAAALVYVEGLVRPELLAAVEERLRRAAPGTPTDTAMLEEWLTNVSGALFPTMESTERPDTAAAAVLEGRVVVLLEGSPVAGIAPAVFAHLMNVPMDYYNRSFDATLKRTVRLLAFIASLTLSPFFVAVVSINQELLPARLFISIAQTRLGVPLPAVAEVLAMEVVVEMVREAGLRMPGSMGQTISIVGAVVIGQSAVIAGLISAPAVVVVSLGYIASAVVPALDARAALRAIRFPLILLAAVFGLFGLVWGLMLLFVYLLALESFGVPYLAPVAPRRHRGLQDTVRRLPLTDLGRSFLARGAGRPWGRE
jgi:spore germination protein KA